MFWKVATFALIFASYPKGEHSIWKANIQSHKIVWTTKRLLVQPISGGEPIYSVKDDHQPMEERGVMNTEHGEVWDDHALLSVVGPVVSIQEQSYLLQGDGTGSSGCNRYITLDLTKNGKPADLRDYFSETSLFEALILDPVVAEAMKQNDEGRPDNLQSLLEALSDSEIDGQKFDDSLLQHFAFHHVEGNRVAIRITGWMGDTGAAHSTFTILGLLLPIPEKLRQPLNNASKCIQGFLQKDKKKISKGRSTFF